MDIKNVIAAISLSAAVIIIYGLFFAPSQEQINKLKVEKEKDKIVKNSETPSLNDEQNISTISRSDAIQESQRIKFENNNDRKYSDLLLQVNNDLAISNSLDEALDTLINISSSVINPSGSPL